MTNIVDSVKAAKKQLDDQTIANDMLMTSKASAAMYFMGALESFTPEMRAMCRSALNQTLDEYAILMELIVNRDWLKPYQSSEQQLATSYKQSSEVVTYHKG